MRSDLSQLFDQLRREPLPIAIASPDVLRREGTRRRRVRRAVTAGLAAASVAAMAATVIAVLPSPQGLIPPPGIGSPTASAPATPTRTTATPTPMPSESATTEATPSVDASPIPDAAFPANNAIDLRNFGTSDTGNSTVLPELCGTVSKETDFVRELVEPPGLLANRLTYGMIDAPDPPDMPAPEGVMFVQIMLFDEGGAVRFLDSLRAAVSACGTDSQAPRGPFTFAVVSGGPAYGDETFAFTASHETQDFESMPPYICEELYEVVRVGDAVMVADVDGWETCSPEPGLDRELRDAAIDAFVAWATTR